MIKLKNGWCIDSDGRCYILQQQGAPDKNGEPTWKNQTYHSTLALALQRLMNRTQMEMIGSGEITLSEAVDGLQSIQNEFKEILAGVSEKEEL